MTNLDPAVSTPWLVFSITGQWCLFGLLVTLALAKHLPQRKNPFLINFFLTNFLATIPPTLLVYADQQHERASKDLCWTQAALIDGVLPMFSLAQFVLIFDTWSELRSTCLHTPHISRKPLVKSLLLFAPYLVMFIWTFLSFAVAFHSQASRYNEFAYCILSSPAYDPVRTSVTVFTTIIFLLGFFLELWVCWMIYRYPTKAQKDPSIWRTTIQFVVRVLIYGILSLLVVFLSLINLGINSPSIKAVYQILTSMAALFAFVVFGTQKSILRVWKFWDRKGPYNESEELELQPQGYPTLDWSYVPANKPVQFNGDGFDEEENGKRRPQFLKAFSRRGE